jgi:predicted regulator of Ras-like GTPase activity (Roadblock/LC7/MglB family)
MFRELLQEMVERTEGGLAGVLMGTDGFAVDQYVREAGSADVETVATEFGAILRTIRDAARSLDAGDAHEVCIRSEKQTTILRLLNDSYFLALTLSPNGNVGKGRYLLRVNAPKLLAELE